MNLYNKIALENLQSVVVTEGTNDQPVSVLKAVLLELASLGYTLDGPSVMAVKTLSNKDLSAFLEDTTTVLKTMVGDHVRHRPLFRKFPDDVPNDDSFYIKRMVGFVANSSGLAPDDIEPLSCGHVIDKRMFKIEDFGACPICLRQTDETTAAPDMERPDLDMVSPLKILKLATVEDVRKVFSNLIAAKSSISESNREVIASLMEQEDMTSFIPNEITMKENLAFVAGEAIKNDYDTGVLTSKFKTATDVLRLAAHMSGGDVSLADKTRFKLSNKQRRMVMSLLDAVKNPEEDLLRYRMEWIRLGEVLHIGSKAKRYPNAAAAIDTLRNNPESIMSFASKVEALVLALKKENGHDIAVNVKKTSKDDNPAFAVLRELKLEDEEEVIEVKGFDISNPAQRLIKLLSTRPGEFARRLDFMLRNADADEVLSAFEKVVAELPTPMLMVLNSHFLSRTERSDFRWFMPKGSIAKVQVVEDDRSPINEMVVDRIDSIIVPTLMRRFKDKDSLGSVYLNPELKKYILPLSQRSASKSLVTVTRGSRIRIPDTDVIRMFLYWKDIKNGGYNSRVDVDLSAVTYDTNWNYQSHLSYTSLSAVGGCHSGDITSAPHGASEFIDITVDKARENGIRYVVMNVISYTRQPFSDFECFAGVMGRDKPKSGEVYEPTTVQHKFDVAGDTTYNIPLIFDLETMEIIWADFALNSSNVVWNNVEASKNNIIRMAQVATTMVETKPTMFELFNIHAVARGSSVDTEFDPDKEYDTVIDVDMATKLDEILADWME